MLASAKAFAFAVSHFRGEANAARFIRELNWFAELFAVEFLLFHRVKCRHYESVRIAGFVQMIG